MLIREYRVCMPLSVDEYQIGQLYMIAKHSAEQSKDGDGVEVVENHPHEDPVHGHGQFTEKRIHLSNKLPTWIKNFVPKLFYVTEKAWNYYPFTITEYTVSGTLEHDRCHYSLNETWFSGFSVLLCLDSPSPYKRDMRIIPAPAKM